MNDVPALFFERIASLVDFAKTLSPGSALSGLLGYVTSEFYEKRCRHEMILNNGQLTKEGYVNYGDQLVYTETPSRKHLQFTGIAIRADREEYSTDPEAMEQVLSATKGKHVFLELQTSNISEEIAKCVESIRLVFEVHVGTKITSDVLKLMRSLVKKNTLNAMSIGESVEIEEETAQLLVDLLKQKQFHRMYLREKCSAALKTIIASWRENSEEMAGKMVYCKEGFSQLQLPSTVSLRPLYSTALKEIIISLREKLRKMVGKLIGYEEEFSELQLSSTEFPFHECTEEEERDAKRALIPLELIGHASPQNRCWRNQDGSALYCFSGPSFGYFKTVFVFA